LLGLAAGTGGLAIACSDNQRAENPHRQRQLPVQDSSNGSGEKELVVYSGRDKKLVGELIQQFEQETALKSKYATAIQLKWRRHFRRRKHSPADVFFAQDAGALGALKGGSVIEAAGVAE